MFKTAYIKSPLNGALRETVEGDANEHWEHYLDPILETFRTRYCAGQVGVMAQEWDQWTRDGFFAAFKQATTQKTFPALTPDKAASFADWFVSPPPPYAPDRREEDPLAGPPEGLTWSCKRLSAVCYLTSVALSDPTGRNLCTAFNLTAALLRHLPRVAASFPGLGQPIPDDDTDPADGEHGVPSPTRWAGLMVYGLALNQLVISRGDVFIDLLNRPAVRAAWNEVESTWPANSGICSTACLLGFKLRATLFDAQRQHDLRTLTRLDGLLQESPEYAMGEDDAGEPDETSSGHLAQAVDHTMELVGV